MDLTAIETVFRIGLLIAAMNVTDLLCRLPAIERQQVVGRTIAIGAWTLVWLIVAGLLGWLPAATIELLFWDVIHIGLFCWLLTLGIIVGQVIWRALEPESADELWGLN